MRRHSKLVKTMGQLRLGVGRDCWTSRASGATAFTVEVSDRADPLDDQDMAIDDEEERDGHGDERQRGAGGHGRGCPHLRGERQQCGGELQRYGPGARHAHVVGQRQRLLDLGPGPAVLHFRTPPSFKTDARTYTVTVTAEDDGGLAGLAVRRRHGDGRGGRRGHHPLAAARVGRNAVHRRSGRRRRCFRQY